MVEFAHRLRLLREQAGSPPYEAMAKQCGFSAPTLARADQGRSVPRWDVVLGYARACAAEGEALRELNERWRSAFPHPGGALPFWTAPRDIGRMPQLIETMHYLWMGCGYPSLRDLCRRQPPGLPSHLVRSTLNDVLRGFRLPSRALLLDYVAVSAADADEGRHAHHGTEVWDAAWQRAMDGGTQQSAPRPFPGPAGPLPHGQAPSAGRASFEAGGPPALRALPGGRSRRPLSSPALAPGPLRDLKELLYEVYLAAGAPTLSELAEAVADQDDLPGAPARDTIRRVLSAPVVPPNQADAVSVAVALARRAAWDPGKLAERVHDLWMAARTAPAAPGKSLAQPLNPLAFEVHSASGLEHEYSGSLPSYVRRDFDTALGNVVAAAAAGRSGVAVLVGTAGSGKTRALWEAVRTLPEDWKVWHPLAPTPLEAAAAGLGSVEPKTVIWLNEAQRYLDGSRASEQFAAELRTALVTPSRGPLLVLSALWPERWNTLVSQPGASGPDQHVQARALLAEHAISVPERFTGAELADVAHPDPRLREALRFAIDGHITQYLAGAPALAQRYEYAPPHARALLNAAIDARRLGAHPHLPLPWLAEAAAGYLTDTEWDTRDEIWLEQSLEYLTQPCNGLPGLLTRTRSRRRGHLPGRGGPARALPRPDDDSVTYQLVDILERRGRTKRDGLVPPIDFWAAAASHAHLGDLLVLGDAARDLGLLRDAAQLYRTAAAQGDTRAGAQLVLLFNSVDPAQADRVAQWVSAFAALCDPHGVTQLLEVLQEAGSDRQVQQLLARDPAAHVELDDPGAVVRLLRIMGTLGAEQQTAALAARYTMYGSVPLPESEVPSAQHRTRPVPVPVVLGQELVQRYRYGREPDGSAAAPWTWEDLT
ncbi:helix-turn-helix transcriptional regulator [Streptomyces sp. NPDC047070]|uniref:helix-turn-helix transcriptional regulator n=1 Tax=Streptomyces sp. NPDC047070 TaxID=3154923 RepID=UPI003453B220